MNRKSESSVQFPPDLYDYHVGWICQSIEDYGAVCELIEEEYPIITAPLKPSIHTPYQLARIEKHNVVINIPSIDSSAELLPIEVARGLKVQFPSIRFFLMVGSGAISNVNGTSVKMGDVVVGTKLIPWGADDKKNSRQEASTLNPPNFLLSSLTALFVRFNGSVLQRSIQAVIDGMSDHDGRYLRPRETMSNLPHNRIRNLHTSSRPPSHLTPQNKQSERPTGLFQGTVLSKSGKRDSHTAGNREQSIPTSEALCVEFGSADILAAGMTCLPILGIARGRNQGSQNNDWSHFAALAAAVCSKQLLASTSPEAVERGLPLDMGSKDLDLMFKDSVKVIDRGMQDGCRLGLPERISQAAQIAEKRMEKLEIWIDDLSEGSNYARQHLVDVQNEMKNIKQTEENMQQDLFRMHEKIEAMKNNSSNEEIRRELTELQVTVKNHASRLETLTRVTQQALEITVDVLEEVAKTSGNKDIVVAKEWLMFVGRYKSLLNVFGSKNTGEATSTTKATDSGAISNGSTFPAADKDSPPKPRIKVKIMQNILWSRKQTGPIENPETTDSKPQTQPDTKKDRPKIGSIPMPASMSSIRTTPCTKSHLHESTTSQTSVSSERDNAPNPRIASPSVLARSRTDSELGRPQNKPPPLPPRTGSSVLSANGSENDNDKASSVKKLATRFNQSGIIIGQAANQRGLPHPSKNH
ncbi:unnamed protein product [Penicillium salamii]|nr:unnamed protein product [Penicillium salamii]CAG8402298.1 unnamed protein product [Penicillium salamii]